MATLASNISAPAHAGWVKYLVKDTHESYVDTATLHKDGDLRRGWRLDDFKQRGPQGEWSQLVGWELDCRRQRYRVLTVTTYAGRMGNGKTLAVSHGAGDWIKIEVDTLQARASGWACRV